MMDADLSNWRSKPQSRWAFHHIAELLPCATIDNLPMNIAPLVRAGRALGENLLQTLFLRVTATDAIVILNDGAIAYEYYANGNDARSRHILMSSTKAIAGLLAGMLEARGAVSLDESVERYVPEVACTGYAGATLRDLLDMRAGVRLDGAQQRAYDVACGWDPPAAATPALELHAFFECLTGPPAAHGGTFSYVSANTDLAGWALERATGTPLPALLSEVLWKPLGAEQPATITLGRGGAPRLAGGMCATARDFARVGQLFCDGGRRVGRDVVPSAVLDDIRTAGDAAAWRDGEWGAMFAPISRKMRYRSGWYVKSDEPEIIFAMGIHGQNLFIDRRHRIVIAKLSSWAKSSDYVALPMTHFAVGYVRRALRRA